jgi:MarR family 2-MHQ and catechol resistance regulon transcriptional repressor
MPKSCHADIPRVNYSAAMDAWDDPRLTDVGLLLEAHAGLIAVLSRVHARHGLAGSDFDTLLRLARSPGRALRMTDLAAQLGLSTSGTTRIVDRLEGRGLARRKATAADRRSWTVVLTATGERTLRDDVPELLTAIQRAVIDPLPPERYAALVAGLRQLRDALRPDATIGS